VWVGKGRTDEDQRAKGSVKLTDVLAPTSKTGRIAPHATIDLWDSKACGPKNSGAGLLVWDPSGNGQKDHVQGKNRK